MRRVFGPSAYNDSPFCRDGIGQGVSRRAGSLALTAGTGSGPEGSRPTAGNRRLQDRGEEKADGSAGARCFWQPPAHPPEMICLLRYALHLKFSRALHVCTDQMFIFYIDGSNHLNVNDSGSPRLLAAVGHIDRKVYILLLLTSKRSIMSLASTVMVKMYTRIRSRI